MIRRKLNNLIWWIQCFAVLANSLSALALAFLLTRLVTACKSIRNLQRGMIGSVQLAFEFKGVMQAVMRCLERWWFVPLQEANALLKQVIKHFIYALFCDCADFMVAHIVSLGYIRCFLSRDLTHLSKVWLDANEDLWSPLPTISLLVCLWLLEPLT